MKKECKHTIVGAKLLKGGYETPKGKTEIRNAPIVESLSPYHGSFDQGLKIGFSEVNKPLVIHTYPNGEERLHDLDGDTCWCGAKGELIIGDDKFDVLLSEANHIIHRAFGG